MSANRCLLRLIAACSLAVLAASGWAQAAEGRGPAQARVRLVPLSSRGFAIDWDKVRLPGADGIPPGTSARCDMRPVEDYALRHHTVYYASYFAYGRQDFAVLPATCWAFNVGEDTNFFLYALPRHGRPRLREVIYQSNWLPSLLTHSVPTAAMAAVRPHGWSGWFEWASPNLVGVPKVPAGTRGVEFTGSQLIIRGLVIPAGGKPPDPAYSVRGLKLGAYIFAWRDGLFRFLRATAGAPPTRPAR